MKKVISTIAVGVGLMSVVSFAQNDTSSYNAGTGSSSDVNANQPGDTMPKSTPGKTMEQKMDNPSDTSMDQQHKDQSKKKKQHKRPSSDLNKDSNKNINSTESNP